MGSCDAQTPIPDGVARCLDRPLVRDELNACINWPDGMRVRSVEVFRFTPRPENRFDIEYRVALENDSGQPSPVVTLYARCPRLEDTDGESSASAQVIGRYVTDVFVDVAGLNATVHSMDRDPVFPRFEECVDGENMSGAIARLLSAQGLDADAPTGKLRCESLNFRPGRRFVVRYGSESPDRVWAGKFYRDSRGRKLKKRHRRLAAYLKSINETHVQIPQLIGYDDDLCMLLTGWDPEALRDVDGDLGDILAVRAADVLAVLQSAPTDSLKPADTDRYSRNQVRWCELLVALQPEVASVVKPLLKRLTEARSRFDSAATSVVHGDYYESQIIIGQDTTTLLDLDTMSVGDRCVDVGNFLAHQWLWCKEHNESWERYALVARRMLDTYEDATEPVNDAELAYYWAATLFRAGAIHIFRDRTGPYAASMWDLSSAVLRNGRSVLERTCVQQEDRKNPLVA